jgi:hypothetical protein
MFGRVYSIIRSLCGPRASKEIEEKTYPLELKITTLTLTARGKLTFFNRKEAAQECVIAAHCCGNAKKVCSLHFSKYLCL